MRLRGFGCLNSPEENGELLLGHSVTSQERLKRIHQEHLETDKLGEDMYLHLSAVCTIAPRNNTSRTHSLGRFSLCLGRCQDLLLLMRCQLCTHASRARHSSSQAVQTFSRVSLCAGMISPN